MGWAGENKTPGGDTNHSRVAGTKLGAPTGHKVRKHRARRARKDTHLGDIKEGRPAELEGRAGGNSLILGD